jgi:hypothetical protein
MPKPPVGHLVVDHLDDEIGPEWLPIGRPFSAPAARSAWRIAREAKWSHEGF